MKIITKILIALILAAALWQGCSADVDEIVGPSANGLTLAISAHYGGAGLENDGTSAATIRVEVYTTNITTGVTNFVDGQAVTLSATLGTLGSTSLTTSNGFASTTLTAGTVTGLAYVVATVENVSATTAVPIIRLRGDV